MFDVTLGDIFREYEAGCKAERLMKIREHEFKVLAAKLRILETQFKTLEVKKCQIFRKISRCKTNMHYLTFDIPHYRDLLDK